MRYYIISGEASGDMHAAGLMRAILKLDPQAEFRFWGGDLMEEVSGIKAVKHYKELAFMGFAEVIANLKTILSNIKFCKSDLLSFKPDRLILVDYPGFNLRIAAFAKQHHIHVSYYISPQIWAWKENRIKIIKKNVDLMLCILPFEKDFYAKHGYKAYFVGNPLLESVNLEAISKKSNPEKTIALLPGSREQEVKKMLPIMLQATKDFPEYKAVIAGAAHLGESFYQKIIQNVNCEIHFNKMHEVLKNANAALVTSGTATLETALLQVPQLVCYIANPISYQIAKRLVKIEYISLVNLIMDKEVVLELIQNDMNVDRLKRELKEILPGGSNREEMLDNYKKIPEILGGKGASQRAAKIIFNKSDQ